VQPVEFHNFGNGNIGGGFVPHGDVRQLDTGQTFEQLYRSAGRVGNDLTQIHGITDIKAAGGVAGFAVGVIDEDSFIVFRQGITAGFADGGKDFMAKPSIK